MIDDKKLREVLQKKIAHINDSRSFPRTVREEVCNLLAHKYNVSYSDSVDIFNSNIPVETLGYNMLFKLMICIKEVALSRWEELDPNDLYAPNYFTEMEIREYELPINDKKNDKDIVISKWLQVNSDQYVCTVSIDELLEWRDLNKIRYNPKTQRRLTEKTDKNVVYKVITVYPESLREIRELMHNNQFISDDITFNIDPSRYPAPKVVRGKLIIHKEIVIDILDGFHRLKEMIEEKTFNKDWAYNCIVNIVMFNEEKANQFILQRDKKNHLTREEVNEKDENSEIKFIINTLNDSNKFNLKKTIDQKKFDIVHNIISALFDLDNRINRKKSFLERRQKSVEISNLIRDNINYIINSKKLFNVDFTPEMWLVSLYLTYFCYVNNYDMDDVLKYINFEKLVSNINFRNYPTKGDYKYLREAVKIESFI